jgi:hypothetical protein
MGDTVTAYLADPLAWWAQALRTEGCPGCGGPLQWHAQRTRAAWTDFLQRAVERLPILRVYCAHCDTTHTLLPDFLTPRQRYQTPVSEAALTGRDPTLAPCAQTIARWRGAVQTALPALIHQIRSALLTDALLGRQDRRFLQGTLRGLAGLRTLREIAGRLGRDVGGTSLLGWVNRAYGACLP